MLGHSEDLSTFPLLTLLSNTLFNWRVPSTVQMEPRFWSTIWATNPINQLLFTATKQPPFCPESTYCQSRRQQKATGMLEFSANLCFIRVFCKDKVWYLYIFHFIISLSNDRRRKAGSCPYSLCSGIKDDSRWHWFKKCQALTMNLFWNLVNVRVKHLLFINNFSPFPKLRVRTNKACSQVN